jgi:hypothetical protein
MDDLKSSDMRKKQENEETNTISILNLQENVQNSFVKETIRRRD